MQILSWSQIEAVSQIITNLWYLVILKQSNSTLTVLFVCFCTVQQSQYIVCSNICILICLQTVEQFKQTQKILSPRSLLLVKYEHFTVIEKQSLINVYFRVWLMQLWRNSRPNMGCILLILGWFSEWSDTSNSFETA